jgi:hypothetical protein
MLLASPRGIEDVLKGIATCHVGQLATHGAPDYETSPILQVAAVLSPSVETG